MDISFHNNVISWQAVHFYSISKKVFLVFFKDFIYLFMRDPERQRHRQKERQAPCREPDVGLDSRTLGSQMLSVRQMLNH